jgi:hypothetical protein
MRDELLQDANDPLALDALVGVDRQAFSRVLVDNRKGSKAPPVEERIRNEIHRPAIIGVSHIGSLQAMRCRSSSFGAFTPQVQVRLAVKSVNPLGIDMPAFTPKQHGDPPVAIADPHGCYLFDAPS